MVGLLLFDAGFYSSLLVHVKADNGFNKVRGQGANLLDFSLQGVLAQINVLTCKVHSYQATRTNISAEQKVNSHGILCSLCVIFFKKQYIDKCFLFFNAHNVQSSL